ncbi:MAG: hypothetical protein UX26_C0006G0023 [Parcubacteria group bacterium GW2011_GWC1_45_9]|nr:MAG: hypothetical protein UW89_C0008G0016 [Parcubacteria group bacterium GW2011_GWB1_45_10]KKU17174.1 MAG: hypothetical protein UX26_C0006G0023 [Parcubacteria group bacterium GW2011_GWC1_45_9]HCI05652.1 hypothetical protein [Patescibacteria group bacterium]
MKNSFQVFSSFFFSILIIFAGVFVLFNLALGEWRKVGEARIQLAERQATVQRLNEMIQKFREQLALFDNLNQQVASIDSALPSSLRIPELLVSLEAIAEANSVLIKHISFTVIEPSSQSGTSETGFQNFAATTSRKDTEPYPVTISMDASGNYLSAKGFLQGIEQELRLLDIKSFDFMPVKTEVARGGDQSGLTFNMKLGLDAYSIKKPQFTLP